MFCAKEVPLRAIKKSFNGIVNKSGFTVILTERLPLKNREVQYEAGQMGIKTVTNNCELQVLSPRKEGDVSFCLSHAKAEILELKGIALFLRIFSTMDNRRAEDLARDFFVVLLAFRWEIKL